MTHTTHTDGILPYWLYLPENIDSRDDWSLIIFLHGRGERGTNLNLVLKHGLPKYLNEGNELPFIIVSPQCPETSRWYQISDTVMQLIETIIEQEPIDKKRVYLTGFSMGGQGTWAVAMNYPEKFAAIAPVSGRVLPEDDFLDTLCCLKNMPMWVFHGVTDEVVEVENSDEIVAKLGEHQANNLTYTRYEDVNHLDTANLAFWNEDLYTWFLKWSRK